ncbi:MAG: AEC family transporter [Kiritimatiellaceae bacterium]|nr:AEC family transporter [Kiritimatiellaceae bacterium]
MHVINSLLPVFVLIILGKWLSRIGFISNEFGKGLNRLTYWIALPSLLLDKVSGAVFDFGGVTILSLLLISVTILSVLVAYLVAVVLKLDARSMGAFVQGAARSNNAFIGLPVILYSMSRLSPDVASLATVALAPAIVFYNALSVCILLAHSDRQAQTRAQTTMIFIKQLFTNPLLLACVIGLLMNYFQLRFPVAIQHSLSALGDTALALALISIGAGLSFKGIFKGIRISLSASMIKVVVQPLIGLGAAFFCDLSPIERQILLIYLACPTATASYVLADIFNSDRNLAANIIVVSTLLSAVTLSIIVAFGGSL